jgi:hypothetical protein
MAILQIPVTNDFWHGFNVDLDGESYQLTFRWNFTDNAWYMDLLGLTNTVDFAAIKITGGIDILLPYAIIELGELYLIDSENENLDANQNDFGDRYQLLYIEKGTVL